MDQGMIGFFVIVILYAVIGVLAAAGTTSITATIFGPRVEQLFYGLFLVLVAAFYLAFVAYFGNPAAWRVETAAVVLFALVGLFGVRLPVALVVGYPLHGLWDLLHEVQAQGVSVGFDPTQLTVLPLAYGVFCAAFDVCIAAYAHKRRAAWSAAWMPRPKEEAPTPPA
jgi:hypothetical protein